MKILKLLNRKYLSIIIIFLFIGFKCYSEDQPVDIWNIDKEKLEQSSENNIINSKSLIRIVDILGKETTPYTNQLFFHIYDDGTVEKKIILE